MNSKDRVIQAKNRLAELGTIASRTQFGGYSLSVDKKVFAVVMDGELYLRACEETLPWFTARRLVQLVIRKRGLFVQLNYFRVDPALWASPQLIELSQLSLNAVYQEESERKQVQRFKDMPNMGMRMELLLFQAGITSIDMMKALGAKRCWIRLRQCNPHLGIHTLLAIQGAILGTHQAALPAAVIEELEGWYQRLIAETLPRRK
ncbi:competence protein TfoX [Enterobacterales bacterium CwR94]|nr:competence protein TfoX [Enterobacterales bacterium CwR94]